MTEAREQFTIGQLATRSGVKLETIRYYEKTGLLSAPPRSASGYRVFDNTYLQRLRFIRRSRKLGFSLAEIAELLKLVDGGDYTCSDMKKTTLRQADVIHGRIRDLQRLEESLRDIASNCSGTSIPECPIVDALLAPDDRTTTI